MKTRKQATTKIEIAMTLLVANCLLSSFVPAMSAETAPAATQDKSSSYTDSAKESKDFREEKAADKKAPLEEFTLNDMQDVGILLRFIKQQSINIYEEASRKPVTPDSGPDLPDIRSIPVSHGTNQKLLPPRLEWLTFFVGTIEPVVRELGKDTKDVESGLKEVKLPAEVEKAMNPLWDKWAQHTVDLNKHLDELVALFDADPKNNQKVQDIAVGIYKDVAAMEEARKQIYIVMSKDEKFSHEHRFFMTPP